MLSGREARISKMRCLAFKGGPPNLLVLYQVQAMVEGEWTKVASPIPGDGYWFSFVTKPKDPDGSMLRSCHRHLVGSMITGDCGLSVREYLAVYKTSAAKAYTVIGNDGVVYEVWDPMAVQAYEVRDGALVERRYGSVKFRRQWVQGTPPPSSPMDKGLLYGFPIKTHAIDSVINGFLRRAKAPGIELRGVALKVASLDIYHTAYPDGVV